MADPISASISLAVSLGSQLLISAFTPKQRNNTFESLNMPAQSDYRRPVPEIFGKVQLEGNRFYPKRKDQLYFVDEAKSGKGSSGSKGGQGDKVYGFLSVMFCEGPADLEALIINGDYIDTSNPFYQSYCTWADGTQTTPTSFIQQDDSPYNLIAYTNIAYVNIEGNDLSRYGGQALQQVAAVLIDQKFGLNPTLEQVVGRILTKAGFDVSEYDVTELGSLTLRDGFTLIQGGESYRQAIEQLMETYLFAPVDTGDGKLTFKTLYRGSSPSIYDIPPEIFLPGKEGSAIEAVDNDKIELSNLISFQYYNVNNGYEREPFPYYIGNRATKEEKTTTIDSGLYTYPEHAEERAREFANFLVAQKRFRRDFKVPIGYYNQFQLLELVRLPHGEINQVQEKTLGENNEVAIVTTRYDQEGIISSPNTGTIVTAPPLNIPSIPDFYVIDTTIWNENDPPATIYVFAEGKADIQGSSDGGANYSSLSTHQSISTLGNCINTLAVGSGIDTVSTLDIQIATGGEPLTTITNAEFDSGSNLLLVAQQNSPGNYWEGEFLQFRDATALGSNTFRISYLKRGLFNTQKFTSSHTSGEKAFLFIGVGAYYSSFLGNRNLINQPINMRAVSSTLQNLATTPVQVINFAGNSYKPPAVTNISNETDEDGNIKITWDYDPSFSPYTTGTETVTFEVDIILSSTVVRTISNSFPLVYYEIDQQTIDGTSIPIDIEVYAVSSVVGRGDVAVGTLVSNLVNNQVFGTSTSGGLNGTKYIDGSTVLGSPVTYTVLEEDDRSLLIVRNATAAEFTILDFADTLPNGFEVEILMDRDTSSGGTNDLNARVSFQCTNFLPDDDNQDLLVGGTCTIAHVGSGNYLTIGNNRRYTFVDDIQQPVAKTTNFVSSDSSLTIVGSTPQSDLLEIDFTVNSIPAAITVFDGATTVTGATSLEVLSGGTVGGTTPNATLTISNGGVSGIEVLTANTTLYVDIQAGSDTTGDGTVGTPYKTPHKALARLESMFLGKYNCTILLTDSGTGGYKIANETTGGNLAPIYLKSYATSGGRAILKCDTGVQIKTTTAFTAVRPPDTDDYPFNIGCINIEKSYWRLENINIDATQFVGTNGTKGLIIAHNALIEITGTWSIDGTVFDNNATCYYFLRLVNSKLSNVYDENLTLNFDGYFTRIFEVLNHSELDINPSSPNTVTVTFGNGAVGQTLISRQYINMFAGSIARVSSVIYSGSLRDNPNFTGSPNPLRYQLIGLCYLRVGTNNPAGDLTTDSFTNNIVSTT